MREMPRFGGYDETPIYTMKTVVQQTGITPTTLRAWERRYGILRPDRSDGGYRLYSEQDIAMLRWLKTQVETGVNIGRAVALLEVKRQEAGDLEMAAFKATPEPQVITPRTPTRRTDAMAGELLEALLAFCETKASAILSESFALYPVEVVTEQVVAPTLVEAGNRWLAGSASTTQEHFVATFLRQRISAMFAAYPQPASGPLAVTGAAPSEWHDIGILMVSIALRRQGWRVIYLGQNVPVTQLIEEIPHLAPELVAFSATTRDTASHLLRAVATIATLPEPRPRMMLGGQAFNQDPGLCREFAGAFLGATASEAVAALAA